MVAYETHLIVEGEDVSVLAYNDSGFFVFVGAFVFLVFLLILISESFRKKRQANAKIVGLKSNTPTEEELLLAMSDTELLRELVLLQRMSLRSQQSQTRVSRLGIFGFLALFSDGE